MAMTFSSNQSGGNSDYMRYVSGPIVKTDNLNSPDLLDFTMVNYDGGLVKLTRGAHIVLTTATYGLWFAGFITNDPALSYLGTNNGVAQWGYQYEASGEEYMLNQKPFGIVAPFINTTQGAILTYLINLLSPEGVNFDTSGIQPGQSVPRFIVDPNKHFTEIVQGFAKSANFQFRCQNFTCTYVQQDSITAGFKVDGNSQHFTPSQLSLSPAGDPIINDSIVMGAIEPQNYMEEYFIGDGVTAQYNLLSAVFGVDSTLLLQDDMSASTIDNTKWVVYDPSSAFLLPYGGALNVLGGNNDGQLDVSLQSQSLVPIEGTLRMTHGEYDFIGGSGGNDGVIGGLWTGQTGQSGNSFPNCLCGIRAVPVGTGLNAGTVLYPVANGIVDTTQSVPINYNLRYVMRTLISGQETKRFLPSFSYRSANGAVAVIAIPQLPDHFNATTIITEIDPLTAVMTNQWTWVSNLGYVLPANGYYVPVASNNLNLTVQSITVSVPMQATLNHMVGGTGPWTQQIIGPNEIDSLDGMAPVATIVDSNNGASTRNSLLGSANLNPGQATLTYFKETAQLISYLPAQGDLVHLSYRGAGASIGRARSSASIAVEAAGWGDDGVRSETKRDFQPQPLTSVECQMAAAARVQDNCYQHWSGTYTIDSGPWFTAQPLAGTLIPFVNLPAQFPNYLNAEGITQVKTTLNSLIPVEQFSHSISFGPTSSVQNVLAAIKVTNDIFTPQDTAEIPLFVDVTALGSTSVPSVPGFLYTGKDANNWYFTFNNPLPTTISGIEIRYSDNGWGADNGNNLITRIANPYGPGFGPSSFGFSIPRTVRGAMAYMRCFDTRNQLLYSEDMTQAAWQKHSGGVTVTKSPMKDIDGNLAVASQIFLPAGLDCYQDTGITAANNFGTFTVDLKGTAGQTASIAVEAEAAPWTSAWLTVTFTGNWQRVSVTSPVFAATQGGTIFCIIQGESSASSTVYANRASFELNTPNETMYCKTDATPYGVTSQFSTGLHTAFPLIPPSPTGLGDFTEIDAPVISVILPGNLTSVWGCEIRAGDNKTVLFHTDLDNATLTVPTATGDTSMVLSQTCPALSARSYSYWLYTYNLFGEYSAGYNFAGILPPPSVSNLNVNNLEKLATWTGNNATAYEFYVDTVDSTLTNLSVAAATINTFYPLADADFFGLRFIAVTPYDALGPGVTIGGYFQYLPDAITQASPIPGAPVRPRPLMSGMALSLS